MSGGRLEVRQGAAQLQAGMESTEGSGVGGRASLTVLQGVWVAGSWEGSWL